MIADEIGRAQRRAEAEAFDRNEQALAATVDDSVVELTPSDRELLQPWLAWCKDQGVRHAPAKPWCAAAFVLYQNNRGVAEPEIVAQCNAIARLHDKWRLANPIATHSVGIALERISKIEAPRSWTKEEKFAWSLLSPAIRTVIARRETERDRALRRIQNEAAALRKTKDAARPVETAKKEIHHGTPPNPQ
jgi:hypothetical protein